MFRENKSLKGTKTEDKIIDVICKKLAHGYFKFGNVTNCKMEYADEHLLDLDCVVNSDTRFNYKITVTNECRVYYLIKLYTKGKHYDLIPTSGKYMYINGALMTTFNSTGYEFLNTIYPYENKKHHIIKFIENEYTRVHDLLPKLKTFLLINTRLKIFSRDVLGLISNCILFFCFFVFWPRRGSNPVPGAEEAKPTRNGTFGSTVIYFLDMCYIHSHFCGFIS